MKKYIFACVLHITLPISIHAQSQVSDATIAPVTAESGNKVDDSPSIDKPTKEMMDMLEKDYPELKGVDITTATGRRKFYEAYMQREYPELKNIRLATAEEKNKLFEQAILNRRRSELAKTIPEFKEADLSNPDIQKKLDEMLKKDRDAFIDQYNIASKNRDVQKADLYIEPKKTSSAEEITKEISLLAEVKTSVFYESAESLRSRIHACQEEKSEMLFHSLFDVVCSHLATSTSDHLSSEDITVLVHILNDNRSRSGLHVRKDGPTNAEDLKKQAQKMAVILGALKKEIINNYVEKQSILGFENVIYLGETQEQKKKREEGLAAKRKLQADIDEQNSRQFILARELPEIKSATMDAILAAFGPEDAKKMSLDLASCIEKANLTPNDKKELLYGLKYRVTHWNEITHPDDIAVQRKKDAEREKERQKNLRSQKK